jgi:amino acid adenylation domain-containing protein
MGAPRFAGLASIPATVAAAAAATPDHPAVSMLGTELSYAELERRSNAVANVLRSHGVQRGDRIGLFAHKSIELLVSMHGAMRAGAAYVPINPDAPSAYVRHILDDCEIRHLVSGRSKRNVVAELAPDAGVQLCLGLEAGTVPIASLGWDEVFAAPTAAPVVGVTGDDLAYVIFTSGSTGRPKGIMHTHRSALAYAEVAAATFAFEPGDRITNHAPLNFDLSTLELFGGVVAGATVVIVPEGHARLPASFARLLEDEAVTVINAVPFALVELLHRGALENRDLGAVRWVLFGGEVYPTKDLRALMHRLPQARFGNVYGPAEVNGCTYLIVPDLAEGSNEPISIGGLYPGMEAMVVDDADRPAAPGEIGELLIRSDAHMIGYWRQPELTERSRFRRPRPDGGDDIFYRTGDLVTENDDGTFSFIGRKDRQIKTRGHRVELDEIETALISHDDVEQAVVFTVPDGDGSQQIEAVVTLLTAAADNGLDGAALRRFAAGKLPKYAVPREVRVVESVPRTTTGKADRVALASQAMRSRT